MEVVVEKKFVQDVCDKTKGERVLERMGIDGTTVVQRTLKRQNRRV